MDSTEVQFAPAEVAPNQAKLKIPTLTELIQYTPEELGRLGLACISLVCATGLPGAEDLDIPAYLARVKEWAALVRTRIPRFIEGFRNNPAKYAHSESYFFMTILVQVLKQDLGIHYNPDRASEIHAKTHVNYSDSGDLLIHGPLGPKRMGTCNNIPMAVVAVAREFGCPVYLTATPIHVYAKWIEPNGFTFNVEATTPAGMTSHPDEEYRDWPFKQPEDILDCGYYFRPFSATDELALCMMSRAWVFEAHDRYAEAAWAHGHACRLAPGEPIYPRRAAVCVGRWMRESYNAGVPEEHRIVSTKKYLNQDLYLDPQRLLPKEHVPWVLTILARYYEVTGKAAEAASIYRAAARMFQNRRNRLSAPKNDCRQAPN